jgi:hypothetical protein
MTAIDKETGYGTSFPEQDPPRIRVFHVPSPNVDCGAKSNYDIGQYESRHAPEILSINHGAPDVGNPRLPRSQFAPPHQA